ncbi:multiheme c-type cytochrome [Alloacidobacterium sp.]|uniref:multiheme c-type cytochrome n=1 Tax=Alloacidobacterium sp. TaxID=2951999 RepID=UPI002D2B37BB|nr:multiheme c-type cytochrome [Alloacidobacterium sp.]HYK37765.1 multiheme c-type cytochrome [Alloacidobacterium sp.]
MMRVVSGGILLGVCVAFSFAAGKAQQHATATSVRVADASCAKCHKDIFEKYLATPMAKASGIATENFEAGALDHKASGVNYRLFPRDNKAMLGIQSTRDPQLHEERQLDYFFGSGHLGITYLYSIHGYLFESPVAYYSASHSYDMKPGLEAITQLPPALPMQAGCLRCHMSAVQHSDEGTINHYSGLPFLHGGITCEACHGDAAQHVATGGKAAVLNPAKLDADRRDSLCISCHLEGDISVERAGHSAIDYKPGDSISDYLSYFVYQGKDLTRRGVSEVEQLNMSMCKRASGDKMSCTSCHDPHYRPAPQERAAFYRSKCLACHSDASFVTTHHPENPDCTSCHMPRTGAENIPHVAWTDHRIRKIPDAAGDSIKDLGEGQTLTPIFSPKATKRDLALAYYMAVLEGNFAVQQQAYQSLEDIRSEISGDKETLNALGIVSEKRGDYKQATDAFAQVVKLDPLNLTALSNLGTLRAKSGDLKGAIDLWRPTFERNEDVVGLAKNLAQVECMTGDVASARATLQKTLEYNPGLKDVEEILARLPSCEGAK